MAMCDVQCVTLLSIQRKKTNQTIITNKHTQHLVVWVTIIVNEQKPASETVQLFLVCVTNLILGQQCLRSGHLVSYTDITSNSIVQALGVLNQDAPLDYTLWKNHIIQACESKRNILCYILVFFVNHGISTKITFLGRLHKYYGLLFLEHF